MMMMIRCEDDKKKKTRRGKCDNNPNMHTHTYTHTNICAHTHTSWIHTHIMHACTHTHTHITWLMVVVFFSPSFCSSSSSRFASWSSSLKNNAPRSVSPVHSALTEPQPGWLGGWKTSVFIFFWHALCPSKYQIKCPSKYQMKKNLFNNMHSFFKHAPPPKKKKNLNNKQKTNKETNKQTKTQKKHLMKEVSGSIKCLHSESMQAFLH